MERLARDYRGTSDGKEFLSQYPIGPLRLRSSLTNSVEAFRSEICSGQVEACVSSAIFSMEFNCSSRAKQLQPRFPGSAGDSSSPNATDADGNTSITVTQDNPCAVYGLLISVLTVFTDPYFFHAGQSRTSFASPLSMFIATR